MKFHSEVYQEFLHDLRRPRFIRRMRYALYFLAGPLVYLGMLFAPSAVAGTFIQIFFLTPYLAWLNPYGVVFLSLTYSGFAIFSFIKHMRVGVFQVDLVFFALGGMLSLFIPFMGIFEAPT